MLALVLALVLAQRLELLGLPQQQALAEYFPLLLLLLPGLGLLPGQLLRKHRWHSQLKQHSHRMMQLHHSCCRSRCHRMIEQLHSCRHRMEQVSYSRLKPVNSSLP